MAKGERNLRINPFAVDEDYIAADEWLDELEREMRFFSISGNAAGKKDAICIYGGVKIRRVVNSLRIQVVNVTDIRSWKEKITDYFASKNNVHDSRYAFLKMRPRAGENTVSYAARLWEQAKNYDYHYCDKRRPYNSNNW